MASLWVQVYVIAVALAAGASLVGADNETTIADDTTTAQETTTAGAVASNDNTTIADAATTVAPEDVATTEDNTGADTTKAADYALYYGAGKDDGGDTALIIGLCMGSIGALIILLIGGALLWRVVKTGASARKLDRMVGQLRGNVQQLEAHVEVYKQNYSRLEESNQALQHRSQSAHVAMMEELQKFSDGWVQFYTGEYQPAQRQRPARHSPCATAQQPGGAAVPVEERQMQEAQQLWREFQHLLADYQETWVELFPAQGIEDKLPLPLKVMEKPTPSPLEREASLLRKFAHPLLGVVAVRPYGVLGVGEDQQGSGPAPTSAINAVVVAPAEWHQPLTGAGRAVCQWLGLEVYEGARVALPGAVETEMSQATVLPRGGRHAMMTPRAKFFSPGRGQYVIFANSAELTDIAGAVQYLTEAYRCILIEFCSAARQPEQRPQQQQQEQQRVPQTLRLLPLCGTSLVRRKLRQHIAEIVFASLSVAFAQLAPSLQETLRGCNIEFCVYHAHERTVFMRDLDARKAVASRAPKLPKSDLGRVAPKDGKFDWVRSSNNSVDRYERLGALLQTAHAIGAGGYIHGDKQVRLSAMSSVENTTVRISSRNVAKAAPPTAPGNDATVLGRPALPAGEQVPPGGGAAPPPPPAPRRIEFNGRATVMEAAARCQRAGKATVAVSAASAYHVGGGALTGGRHALEEAWCVTSTLLPSLQRAEWDQVGQVGVDGLPQQPAGLPHIPVDGCIITPGVEIFRQPSDYAFMDKPVKIAGVVSVAMFNLNGRVADSPVDAPQQFNEYCAAVKEKFRAVVEAAESLKAEVLVCPPVGCGVFGNDAKVVGSLLGEVLYEMPELVLPHVVITGLKDFYEAADQAAKGVEVERRPPQFFGAGCARRMA